jgi:hypothetical protein
VVLLYELDWPIRLSTANQVSAIMLASRVRADPRYSSAREILESASELSRTWSSRMENLLEAAGIQPTDVMVPRINDKPPYRRRAPLAKFKHEQVCPALVAFSEDKWWSSGAQQSYLAKHGADHWRACHASDAGVSLKAISAWARLRIQGSFKPLRTMESQICRLCGLGIETADHLLLVCAYGRELINTGAQTRGILRKAIVHGHSGLTALFRGRSRRCIHKW